MNNKPVENGELRETILSILGIVDRTSGNRPEQIATLEQELTAHTNAEIAKVLDRLEQEVKITIYDGDDSLGKEYQAGYNSMAVATRIFQSGVMYAIQAERAKLKERDDER